MPNDAASVSGSHQGRDCGCIKKASILLRMIKLYHFLCGFFKRKRKTIAERLSPEALASLQKEAVFLAWNAWGGSGHAVADHEAASAPRAVDETVEAMLVKR